MNNLVIRNEREADHHTVEAITREAFWNQYMPGCDEHYLVHCMRAHPDFIPELALVAELGREIVGSIFFTRSHLVDQAGARHETITFGPVSVSPDLHRQGIGSALIRRGMETAKELGHRAVLIYGYPDYYRRFGFRPGKDFGITNPDGQFPAAHLALELFEGALLHGPAKAYESDLFHVDEAAALAFDGQFPPKVKAVTPSQALFQKMASTFL